MKNTMLIWSIIRILTFIIVGVFNTLFIKPEDIGTWKNYLGYFLLAFAIYDIVTTIIRYRKMRQVS